MEHENQPDEELLDSLPESLVDALKQADKPVPVITARADHAVRAMAEEQFRGRAAPRRVAKPAWVAIAASLLIAVLVVQNQESPAPAGAGIYADVDGSGRIDIADVLQAARSRSDLSRAEIDAFAFKVVSLTPVGDAS